MESILTSVKRVVGIVEDDTSFDDELTLHINSVLVILTQIGVGPTSGFSIRDESAKWTDFIPETPLLETVKSFVGLKTRLIFDPPQSSTALESLKNVIAELEWRISVTVDPGDTFQDTTK